VSQNRFIQELFDGRAPVYDEWVGGFWKAYAERIDRETLSVLLEKKGPVSLIDIGCATGSRLKRLLDAAPSLQLGELAATDISHGMMAEARKNLASFKANLFQADATSLPVESKSYDVALMLYAVLGCLPGNEARRSALAECARILKPGGILVIDVLSRSHEFYLKNPEFFERARAYKAERNWTWEEGDLLVEVEPGRPSLNHGFLREELESLAKGLFSRSEWRCYDTETGAPSDESSGHFFGILKI
jgi:ubiquinone/menaquinone biosynthesis C-methylase UbiE